MEKLITDYLKSIFENVIIPQQPGFRKKRSIYTNLILYTEYISKALEDGFMVDSFYTNFSKEFDKLEHNTLTTKFFLLGIIGELLT